MTRLARIALLAALGLCGLGCSEPATYRWKLKKLEFAQFQETVYPVLIRDCGFPTCHGSTDRFFQVWGPGRARLNPMLTSAFDMPTGDEISLTYTLALSMVDTKHPGRSLLLRKPLAVQAGGAGHRGTDRFGRDVYRTTNDDGYLAIARWVFAIPADGTQPMQTPAPTTPAGQPVTTPPVNTPPPTAGAGG
jgi:hypothetical protein